MIRRLAINSMLYILFLFLFAYGVQAGEITDFPGIQQLMSRQQFENAGLTRLSADEIAALNQWLTEYTANEAGIIKRNSATVKKAAKEEQVKAKIVGKFEGWSGDTVFNLDNGQVWKQRLRGRYHANAENPDIVISKSWMGFYRLTVVSSGRSVGVQRIK